MGNFSKFRILPEHLTSQTSENEEEDKKSSESSGKRSAEIESEEIASRKNREWNQSPDFDTMVGQVLQGGIYKCNDLGGRIVDMDQSPVPEHTEVILPDDLSEPTNSSSQGPHELNKKHPDINKQIKIDEEIEKSGGTTEE